MPEKSKLLRFDGIYQCEENNDGEPYSYYIRFYKDDTVITETFSGSPSEIIDIFNRESDDVSIGKYYLQGNKIKFTSTNKEGAVDYKGTIYKNKLVLEWFSHINSASSTEEYKFIPIKKSLL